MNRAKIPSLRSVENVPWLVPVSARVFVTTRWTVIAACRHPDNARALDAIAEVCQAYWQPVYVCIRHYGHSSHDAQDLTQDFFLRLIQGAWIDHLDASRGRFRAYLSVALRNFLNDRWRRQWSLRRGRGQKIFSFDATEAESKYSQTPTTNATPETLYERQWAASVVDYALQQLRIEMQAEGREILFGHFDSIMTANDDDFLGSDVARSVGLNAGALRAALLRWRRRFQALVRAEIARTVASKSEIEDELTHLYRVFARPG